jgi:hypothetical protein
MPKVMLWNGVIRLDDQLACFLLGVFLKNAIKQSNKQSQSR